MFVNFSLKEVNAPDSHARHVQVTVTFTWMTKLKSVLTPWLTSVTRLSGFTNRHLQNSLHVALFRISALRCSALASASEAKPIYSKYSSSPSSPTTSLYLKRWLIMLGPCVFMYLLSKPSGVLALKWEKALRGRPFAERGWRWCVEGDSLLAGAG